MSLLLVSQQTQLPQSCTNQSISYPTSASSQITAPQFEFCSLKAYKNKFLLAYNSNALALLNVENSSVAGGLYSLSKINSVAVNKDEIFILEGHRRIRRLASQKDRYWHLKSSMNSSYEMFFILFYTNVILFLRIDVPENSRDSQIGEKLLDIVSKIKEEASATVMKPLIDNLTKTDTL